MYNEQPINYTHVQPMNEVLARVIESLTIAGRKILINNLLQDFSTT